MLSTAAPPIAIAAPLQGAVVVAAAFAAAAVLLLPHGARRGAAMVVALLASAGAILTLVGDQLVDEASARPLIAAFGAGIGLAAVGAVVLVLGRRPHLVALLALGALPFRVPVPVGDGAANLLVPLYVVIAGGCVAYLLRERRPGEEEWPQPWPPLTLLERVLAAAVVLYALQSVYSQDLDQAAKNVAFFYVPFAVLFRLAVDVPWTPRMLRTALWVVGGLALAFAAVAFVEFATGHLLIPNPKVLAANEAKEYFRVNSLFFDPNIYGRFVALAMIGLAAMLLWSRRTQDSALLAGALAILWAGLVLSLSQSSFATLLVGLAVLAAVRWRPLVVSGVVVVAIVVGVAVVAVSPGTFGLENTSEDTVNKATAGRAKLIEGGLEMVRDRPVVGFGSGSFAAVYRERKRVVSPVAAAESHTIPLTVAAEQGLVGLLAYLALLGAALRVVFTGIRRKRTGMFAVARAGVAAAFCGLVVHTLGYAAFLEDPLTWTLLAIAAALGRFAPGPGDARPPRPAAEPA